MEHHDDVGLLPLDRSMRKQRVDAASVGRLLCPLSASKLYDHNGGLQTGYVSAAHLVQSPQSERQYMVHLHNNADKWNATEMAHQTGSFQNSMFKQNIPEGKESMVQLLTGNSNVPSAGSFLSSDTLRNIAANPGAGIGDVNNFTTNQYGFSGMGGMRGPMQDLLNSFTTRVTNGIYMDINNGGQSICEQSTEETCSQICAEAHAPVFDESGYESSDSSLYDVYSDDENYGNNCAGPGEDKSISEEENLVDCNHDSEQLGSADGQIEEVDGDNPCNEEVPDCQCITGNPYMHVMTELAEGDDDTTTWKKRTRSTSGEKRPDFRVTKGMGPIEIALRNAPTRRTKYIFEPLLGITFDSEPEAFDFYNMYSWEVGFGIKRENLRRSTTDGSMTRRDLRCLCHGVPQEGQSKSKKTGCKAMLRLLRSKDDGWYISQHISEHNHPLTETCGQTNEWRSHERLDANAIDMIKYLRENNVSLTKVHCFMGSVFGSMDKIPFSKRALRAICRRIAKDQMDDDVQKVLNTFREMRKLDEGFQCSFLPDEKNRIKSLMWINGNSKQQYQCFGDVITFDTTYCTNIYKMPFGLFVGVNNHFQTIIFGGVFMKDETIPSFKWVFEEFVSLMGGKLPQTVFTDQCAAMASALSSVWKGTTHLLCKWHIFKDAGSKLGPIYRKGSPFRKLFHKIINDMLTVDEFERAWAYMLDIYNLHDNEYLENIYDKREKWAKAYFKGCFCARMASTQRSESANHMLKRFVPRNSSMNRFIIQFSKFLFDRNNAEDRAEFDTKIFNDVRDSAWPVQEHAAKFYTAAAYGLFRKEISKATKYFAIQKVENKEYDVVCAQKNKKHAWGREKFTVTIDNEGETYDCECGLYQHFGMLCSHVLRVFFKLGVCEIPKAHIHKRWTRSARDILPERLSGYQKDTLCMQSMTFRHSYLYVNAMTLVQDGNRDLGAFDIAAKYMKKAQKKLKEYYKAKENVEKNGKQTVVFMQRNYDTTESDVGAESGYDTEGRPMNSYGAAGSCAGMSDSELLRMKAPTFNRKVGRPRETRFKGAQDYYAKKQKRKYLFDDTNEETTKKKKALPRCGDCLILGHTAKQCKKKVVDSTTELPEF